MTASQESPNSTVLSYQPSQRPHSAGADVLQDPSRFTSGHGVRSHAPHPLSPARSSLAGHTTSHLPPERGGSVMKTFPRGYPRQGSSPSLTVEMTGNRNEHATRRPERTVHTTLEGEGMNPKSGRLNHARHHHYAASTQALNLAFVNQFD